MRSARPLERITSVIIANHNYASYLPDAIGSALAQEGAAVEVIVVDDGSTDDSAAVLRHYDGQVVVVRQHNRGQAAAWNVGFGLARGDLVVFLDADDRLHPSLARDARRCLESQPDAARVHYPMRCIDASGLPTGQQIPWDAGRLPRGDLRGRVLLQPDDVPWQPTSGNAYRAQALARVLPMPEAPYRISADHYLSNVTALLGPVLALARAGADYRIHGANADFRHGIDLDRIRETIVRTCVTHRCLHQVAAEEGLGPFPADPLAVPSITFLASRVASLRLGRSRHPVPSDTLARLCFQGVMAARLRRDLVLRRRLAWAVWFAAASCVPRRAVEPLVTYALRPPTWRRGHQGPVAKLLGRLSPNSPRARRRFGLWPSK